MTEAPPIRINVPALHTQLDDARACIDELHLDIDALNDENDALAGQLDAARREANAVKDACAAHQRDLANARTQLDAIKADPLHTQLQDALRQNRSLAQRLQEMTEKSRAMDVPLR